MAFSGLRQSDQPKGLLKCPTGLYFPGMVSVVHGLPVMAVRPEKCKQVVTSRSCICDSVRNYNVMMQHQNADAMQKNLNITAAKKTVIISTHLLKRQNEARGINSTWRTPRMCLNQQPHNTFMRTVSRFAVVIFPLVRSDRLSPTVNINVRGTLKYNLMRIALIPFTRTLADQKRIIS